ncbi:hypothetical protein D9M69_322550 [compost metagenome]
MDRQRGAAHIDRAAAHGIAGDDVLADRFLHEPLRRNDAYLAGLDVGLVDNAADAAVVVDVGMADDYRDDRAAPQVLRDQVERGPGGLGGGQRIEDDPAAIALDQRHVGEFEAAHLVNAVGDLVQPVVAQKLGIAPQARIDRVGHRLVVADLRPECRNAGADIAVCGTHGSRVRPGDQATLCVLEILPVLERQLVQHRTVCRDRGSGGRLRRYRLGLAGRRGLGHRMAMDERDGSHPDREAGGNPTCVVNSHLSLLDRCLRSGFGHARVSARLLFGPRRLASGGAAYRRSRPSTDTAAVQGCRSAAVAGDTAQAVPRAAPA